MHKESTMKVNTYEGKITCNWVSHSSLMNCINLAGFSPQFVICLPDVHIPVHHIPHFYNHNSNLLYKKKCFGYVLLLLSLVSN